MINGTNFMSNNKNTIVTSIYQLRYDPVRGGEVYKNFPLLTETIRALFYDDYNYVIYTDQNSCDQYQLKDVFSGPNITIKIKELNSPEFIEQVEPTRLKRVADGEIWERLYAVVGYTEVILNKLDNILEVSKETNGNVIWLDAGLFGTSCDNAWRDLMKDKFVHCKNFLDKIFEKVEQYGFIATKGNNIVVNYEVRERLQQITNADVNIIPGCLFGGNTQKNIEILTGFRDINLNYVQKYGQLVSEQELLSVMTNNKDVKFFEFDDWNDLQKAFLKILDVYDENTYGVTDITHYK
jgi:hypothetical protein